VCGWQSKYKFVLFKYVPIKLVLHITYLILVQISELKYEEGIRFACEIRFLNNCTIQKAKSKSFSFHTVVIKKQLAQMELATLLVGANKHITYHARETL